VAVLTGALALPACSGSEPAAPAHTTSAATTTAEASVPQAAPPGDAAPAMDASTPAVDRGVDPAVDPAVDAAVDPAARGSLVIIPRLGTSKKPLQRFVVSLMRPGAEYGKGAVTGSDGRAHFDDLAPGEYIVRWQADSPQRRAPPPPQSTKKVTVVADKQIEIEISVHSFSDHPVVTPYGAPSARRRLV
jgi:hypothetical protein